jgi:BlaI family transcriptional regulator, penicillinase repressor
MMKKLHGLGSLQSEVMDLAWEHGDVTVAQVAEAIGRRRRVTYTTVLSAMQKLEKKGWIKHRSAGRAYIYSPTRNREQVGGRTLKELLKTTFQGDPRLLLASLLEEARLSDAELKELRQLIDTRRQETRHD